MRNGYAISRVKVVFTGPFTSELQKRVWGEQWVMVDADNIRALAPSLCGNSKQRRQQRRAILRVLNEV